MKQKYLTLSNIWARLKSESPTFFKRLKIWALSISAFGVTLIALKSQYPTFLLWLPDNYIGYVITFGAACTFVSSLAVADPKDNAVK
jgi:hypothetical protein